MKHTTKLRNLIEGEDILLCPGTYDPLMAKLIKQLGFEALYMTGAGISHSTLAMPDLGLTTMTEMVHRATLLADASELPLICDADTGYGNALNVKRTIQGYAQAGFACAMIEDQVAPKRCGHTRGKQVVTREEALGRIQAAVDAREEGADILIMARTDARATDGFEEAMWRIKAFSEIGADILFLEAPESEEEMRAFCDGVEGPKMANLVEQGDTPLLPTDILGMMGYKIVLYPLTMLNSAMTAMEIGLEALKEGR